jgi:hypothetical protein
LISVQKLGHLLLGRCADLHLRDTIDASNLCSLNLDRPTCLPVNGASTLPDISLISAHLMPSVAWTTDTMLNSDHLPLSISFLDDPPSSDVKRTFINFGWANWDRFEAESEVGFHGVPDPTSCVAGAKVLCNVILKASKQSIPTGCRKDFIPGHDAIHLVNQRDTARQQDSHDPEIDKLSDQILEAVIENKCKVWIDKVKDSNHCSNPQKRWNLVRSLSSKTQHQSSNLVIRSFPIL